MALDMILSLSMRIGLTMSLFSLQQLYQVLEVAELKSLDPHCRHPRFETPIGKVSWDFATGSSFLCPKVEIHYKISLCCNGTS